jgi:hypothetical protein
MTSFLEEKSCYTRRRHEFLFGGKTRAKNLVTCTVLADICKSKNKLCIRIEKFLRIRIATVLKKNLPLDLLPCTESA